MKRILFLLVPLSYILTAEEPLPLTPNDPLILSKENQALLHSPGNGKEIQLILKKRQFPWFSIFASLLFLGLLPYLLRTLQRYAILNAPCKTHTAKPLSTLDLHDLDQFTADLTLNLKENRDFDKKVLTQFLKQLTYLRYRENPPTDQEKELLRSVWTQLLNKLKR